MEGLGACAAEQALAVGIPHLMKGTLNKHSLMHVVKHPDVARDRLHCQERPPLRNADVRVPKVTRDHLTRRVELGHPERCAHDAAGSIPALAPSARQNNGSAMRRQREPSCS